jgi:hypothetical protein
MKERYIGFLQIVEFRYFGSQFRGKKEIRSVN